MEQVDLRREAGQVGRFLERRVAAADDRDLAVAEEEPVARRARRDAAAAKTGLAVEAEPQRRGAGRDDHGLGAVLGAAGPDAERARGEVDAIDVDVDEAGTEPLGLGAHRGHQVGALDALGKARIVLDVAGQHQLATGRRTGKDDGLEVGAGGIDRRGEPGRPGTDDDQLRFDGAARPTATARAAGRRRRGRRAALESSTMAMLNPPKGLLTGGVAPFFCPRSSPSCYHATDTPGEYRVTVREAAGMTSRPTSSSGPGSRERHGSRR